MAKLIFVHEKFVGQSLSLPQGKTSVGRGAQNSLVIPDASVSTEHCHLLVNGPEILVCERGSANGTFIDGVRVQGQRQIRSGQELRFGAVTAKFQIESFDESTQHEEMSAISALKHINQVQKQTPPPSQPVKLQGPQAAEQEEATVTLSSSSIPVSAPNPQFAVGQSQGGGSTGASRLWVIAGAIMVAAVVAFFFLRRGH